MRITIRSIVGKDLTAIHICSFRRLDGTVTIPAVEDLQPMFYGFVLHDDPESPGDLVAWEHSDISLPPRELLEAHAVIHYCNSGCMDRLYSSLGKRDTEIYLNSAQGARLLSSSPYPVVVADRNVVFVQDTLSGTDCGAGPSATLVIELMYWLGIEMQGLVRNFRRVQYTFTGRLLTIMPRWKFKGLAIAIPANATRKELFEYIIGKLNNQFNDSKGIPTNGKNRLRMNGTGVAAIRTNAEPRCYVDGIYIGGRDVNYKELYNQYAALRKADLQLLESKEAPNV